MINRGKNIRIYLMDGATKGPWMCELSNWVGKAYKIPRTSYIDIINREELRHPSVYFLFGYNETTSKPIIYIGETEDAIKRLGEHIRDEDKAYWVEAIVFINKDDHLNKAHIKYLESRFYDIANEIDRYEIMNSLSPKKSALSEAEQSEMEEFISNVKIIVPVLGHKVFEPLRPIKEVAEPIVNQVYPDYLFIKKSNAIFATGMVSSDGFIVLKDSNVNKILSNTSVSSNTINLREHYRIDGTLVDNVLSKDILFSSPSSAAEFIIGYSISDARSWKNIDGKSIKKLNEEVS